MGFEATGNVGYKTGNENVSTKQSGSSTTSRGTGTAQTSNEQLLSVLMDKLNLGQKMGDPFSKEAAVADATAVADASFKKALENSTVSALLTQNLAGAYNSTAAQAIAQEGAAEAAGVRAKVIQDNIANYANISSQQQSTIVNSILGAIKTSQSGTESTDTQSQTDTKRKYDELNVQAGVKAGF